MHLVPPRPQKLCQNFTHNKDAGDFDEVKAEQQIEQQCVLFCHVRGVGFVLDEPHKNEHGYYALHGAQNTRILKTSSNTFKLIHNESINDKSEKSCSPLQWSRRVHSHLLSG